MTVGNVRARSGAVSLIVGLLALVLGFIFVTAIDKQTAEWVYVEWALLAGGSVLGALGANQLLG